MKLFRFIGAGAGVPGLPSEITDIEAKNLGVEALLVEAVKNGNFVEVEPSPKADGAKKKEVNNG